MTAFGALFDRVRETSPLVHCISNLVSANDCANIVLAAGASPIMADDPEEVEEITALSRALCLSLGTPNPRKAEAMVKAGRTAARLGLPVVFDPVGVGASQFRQSIAAEVLREVPVTVLRCNASELQALSGLAQVSRGVDAGKTLPPEALRPLAEQFAAQHHCVAAVTGAEDIVTDGEDDPHPPQRHSAAAACDRGGLYVVGPDGGFRGGQPRPPAGCCGRRRLCDGPLRRDCRCPPDRRRGHRNAAHVSDGCRVQPDRRTT